MSCAAILTRSHIKCATCNGEIHTTFIANVVNIHPKDFTLEVWRHD